ncbi:hypothetical protein SMICM17S_05145 [Streptomyces microflavus]
MDGIAYATAEHWMMAGKARLFGDPEAKRAAVSASSPAAAKKAGRLVRGFDEDVWIRERFALVVEGSTQKFGQSPELAGYLLGTGDRVLVEASPLDRIWGIGLAADDARVDRPQEWRGLNLLGFALMEARARLRAGAPQALRAWRRTRQRRPVRRGVVPCLAGRRMPYAPGGSRRAARRRPPVASRGPRRPATWRTGRRRRTPRSSTRHWRWPR